MEKDNLLSSSFIETALAEASQILESFLTSPPNISMIKKVIDRLSAALGKGQKVISCGNGGSLCDAMHFSEELTGRFRQERAPLPAMAISDPAHLSCVANDYGLDQIFSRHIQAFGQKGDLLVALSTSGNSPNILAAAQMARQKEMEVIGLIGRDGGALLELSDYPLVIPANCSDRIQEMHIKIIHIFIEGIERQLFPENYQSR